jgi:hypothetical protein
MSRLNGFGPAGLVLQVRDRIEKLQIECRYAHQRVSDLSGSTIIVAVALDRLRH